MSPVESSQFNVKDKSPDVSNFADNYSEVENASLKKLMVLQQCTVTSDDGKSSGHHGKKRKMTSHAKNRSPMVGRENLNDVSEILSYKKTSPLQSALFNSYKKHSKQRLT